MYLVFTRMLGESYRKATRAFVVVLVLRISNANEFPCMLILTVKFNIKPSVQ